MIAAVEVPIVSRPIGPGPMALGTTTVHSRVTDQVMAWLVARAEMLRPRPRAGRATACTGPSTGS